MAAENQANVKFSYKKYYSFRNRINTKFSEKFYSDMQVTDVTRALCYGDTQPAVVVSVEPLLIAAYSDEMDAVAMLLFPSDFAERYGLRPGSRLTTSNIYFGGTRCAADLFPGANFSHQFSDFMPIVQLFLGKKDEKIKKKVELFPESRWQRVEQLASEYREAHPDLSRDGFNYFKKH